MIEKIKKTHRERLVTASFRSRFSRLPTDDQLTQWSVVLKNAIDFQDFLKQIKQSNDGEIPGSFLLEAKMLQSGIESNTQNTIVKITERIDRQTVMRSMALETSEMRQLSPRCLDIVWQLKSAFLVKTE